MGFKKRFRRRFGHRGGRRRSGFRSRKTSRFIKRVVRRMSEIKRVAVFGSATTQNTIQVQLVTPAILQGPDKNQRIGNRVQFKFLTLWVTVNAANNAPATSPLISLGRIVLATARQSTVNNTVIVEDGVGTTPTIQTSGVPYRSEVLNVLKDKKFVIAGAGPAGALGDSSIFNVPTSRTFKLSVKMPRRVLYQDSLVTTPQDPQDLIYLILSGTNNTMDHLYEWGGRLSYYDI